MRGAAAAVVTSRGALDHIIRPEAVVIVIAENLVNVVEGEFRLVQVAGQQTRVRVFQRGIPDALVPSELSNPVVVVLRVDVPDICIILGSALNKLDSV